MSIALSINLNKIALIRNSREGNFPDLKKFGQLCLDNGANGLTVHPRPDQRHIKPCDTRELALVVKYFRAQTGKNIEFNIEGNPQAAPRGDYPGLIPLALETQPDQCTLVPDTDTQKTSDHGFDLTSTASQLEPMVRRLKDNGIRVSLFMDPDIEQIRLAKEIGADRIELYTGPFAQAFEQNKAEGIFQQHCEAAQLAQSIGLGINAGHDLNVENMAMYRKLPGLQEVSIGHALTVDALLIGMKATVQRYLSVCQPG